MGQSDDDQRVQKRKQAKPKTKESKTALAPTTDEDEKPSGFSPFTGPEREKDSEVSLCAKYTVFGFNVLWFLLGFVILSFTIWAMIDKDNILVNVKSQAFKFFDPLLFFLILGLFIFIVGFAGCIGALRENLCCLTVYNGLLTIVLLIEMIAVAIIIIFREKIEEPIRNGFLVLVEKYRDDEDLQLLVDQLQLNYQCCGIKEPSDWERNIYFSETYPESLDAGGVPFSCCRSSATAGDNLNLQCGKGARLSPDSANVYWADGCYTKFEQLIDANWIWATVIIAALWIFQMIALCFSQALKGGIKAQRAKWSTRE